MTPYQVRCLTLKNHVAYRASAEHCRDGRGKTVPPICRCLIVKTEKRRSSIGKIAKDIKGTGKQISLLPLKRLLHGRISPALKHLPFEKCGAAQLDISLFTDPHKYIPHSLSLGSSGDNSACAQGFGSLTPKNVRDWPEWRGGGGGQRAFRGLPVVCRPL